jgi:enamine deaminase RidA (YjgF/YER057c/UK114 family)
MASTADDAALRAADAAFLRRAGVALPPLPAPIGTFVAAVESGGFLHLSGQAPLDAEGRALRGKAGAAVSPDEARRRAGLAAATLVALVALVPGRLLRVRRVVRVLGMVNAGADFTAAHEVMDGCSEVLERVFPGGHARTDVVLPALPNDITVEVEAVLAVEAAAR